MFRAPDSTPSAPAPLTPDHLANAFKFNSLKARSSSAALSQPAQPQLNPVAQSADSLDEADILKIVSFPEPY
ncbi:hypothetical protein PGTUg99_030805 [Puccinia graminis f. sp. tritici]|uniref:Uncharacterized protein n=1 Tax=Puccinia graminis f. sp. tritici TaxID=56615 RepID=A0A5B0S7W1_PUCGR|nr:hypothetical protein PGTUg99_030805 [Puccinia graminis f. sp. tritici]